MDAIRSMFFYTLFLSFVSDYLILFLRTHSLSIHHLWHWMAYNVLMCR